MRSFVAMLFVTSALGCGGATESTPTTPTTDAAVTDSAADVVGEAALDAKPDASCDLGTIPAVAPLTAEFVVLDADGGVAIPTPTGGDPKGDWRYSKLTVYLSPAATSVLDISKSSIEGWGFGSYTDTTFRNSSDQKTTLETTVAGTIKRGTVTKGKGTYKVEGNELVYTPVCGESTGDAAPLRVGWSRISADKARLQFKPPPMGGADFTQQIVIDLELIK